MANTSQPVELYIYDLSRGMAGLLSQALIGQQIDGIWHTSIVVYGTEYFFGSRGIASCNPGTTVLGSPQKRLKLGESQIPYSIFNYYIHALGESKFRGSAYELLSHNCNNFSEELAQFLCGAHIPKHILDLPNEILQTRLGPTLQLLTSQLEQSVRPVAEENSNISNPECEESRSITDSIEERRSSSSEKLARQERKKEKKRKKLLREASNQSMAETMNGGSQQLPSEQAIQFEEEERLEEEKRKQAREPPIVFRNVIDANTEYEALVKVLDNKVSPEELQALDELRQYMLCDEGSWVVGEGFLNFIGRLLNDTDVQNEVRIHVLNILAAAALKDDVILVLHQDRKDHVLMNYAFEIDRISVDEQQSLAFFIANMFENLSSSEWLLYISEWTYNSQQISNIRVTTKVAVHSLLADSPELQDKGSAIIYNMACKEVFDDVAVELTMALLQHFNSKLSEEQLWRCMKSLAKFTQIAGQDVPQLIQMIGPNPNTFKGVSPRIDEQIQFVIAKLH